MASAGYFTRLVQINDDGPNMPRPPRRDGRTGVGLQHLQNGPSRRDRSLGVLQAGGVQPLALHDLQAVSPRA